MWFRCVFQGILACAIVLLGAESAFSQDYYSSYSSSSSYWEYDSSSYYDSDSSSYSSSSSYSDSDSSSYSSSSSYQDFSDFDNDGLSDEEEIELGTNPYDADSDGGGVNDGDEVNYYLSDPWDYLDDYAAYSSTSSSYYSSSSSGYYSSSSGYYSSSSTSSSYYSSSSTTTSTTTSSSSTTSSSGYSTSSSGASCDTETIEVFNGFEGIDAGSPGASCDTSVCALDDTDSEQEFEELDCSDSDYENEECEYDFYGDAAAAAAPELFVSADDNRRGVIITVVMGSDQLNGHSTDSSEAIEKAKEILAPVLQTIGRTDITVDMRINFNRSQLWTVAQQKAYAMAPCMLTSRGRIARNIELNIMRRAIMQSCRVFKGLNGQAAAAINQGINQALSEVTNNVRAFIRENNAEDNVSFATGETTECLTDGTVTIQARQGLFPEKKVKISELQETLQDIENLLEGGL